MGYLPLAGCRPGRCRRARQRYAQIFLLCGSLYATHGNAQIVFDDVTKAAGMEYSGESYGASWGDMNADGLPDLFVSHHRNPSSLYINRGNGTFQNRRSEVDVWQKIPRADVHGGTWADYDNNGRLDLVISAGSYKDTDFLINDGTKLSNHIADFTFDRRQWGGRLPFWFDYNNDGLLDLGMVVQGDKIQLHEQVGGDFERRNFHTDHQCVNGDWSSLADMTQDGRLDWVCVNADGMPERVYDLSGGLPFKERANLANIVGGINDVAIADFDGDLMMDLFAVRGKVRVNGAAISGPRSVEAHFTNSGVQATGMTFRSSGDLSIELHWSGPNVNQVFIGAGGKHPPATDPGEPIRMLLPASDPKSQGLMAYDPATNRGVFVGYNPATSTWTYVNSAGGSGNFSYTYSFLDSTAAVSDLNVFGVPGNQKAVLPAMVKYAGTRYTDQIAGTGLDHAVLCNAVAAADFDNDMDVDLYYVCREGAANLPNRLYLNDGTGRFKAATAPFGAEGPVGTGVGLGENVAISDFNVDGFVDLYVTNGLALYPEEPYGNGGPDKLYRNRGNTNRWVELDLVGVKSNRDGIGATVTATAGGKTQKREQNGGYHRWAQNDSRVHFGLGTSQSVNLRIEWPSGTVDNYTNVASNALYEAVEGATKLAPHGSGQTLPPTGPDPLLYVDDTSASEGASSGVMRFVVRLSPAATKAITVNYATANGTATSPGDFTARSGSLSFPAGTTTRNVDIPVINDNIAEAMETFTLALSSPSGAALGDSSATATIIDDDSSAAECGPPAYNKSVDNALFVWQDCSTGRWSVRVMAGSSTAIFVGNASASAPFSNLAGFSVEADDSLASTPSPARITFKLNVSNGGQDGFNFTAPTGACLTLESPARPVYYGPGRKPVGPAVDLATGGACATAGTPPTGANPLDQWLGATGGVSASGNLLAYSGSPTGWAKNTIVSRALSSLGYAGSFEVRFRLESSTGAAAWAFGLGTNETEAGWRDLEYGLRIDSGQLSVYESGTWRAGGGPASMGDSLSIAVSPGVIEYRINGVTFWSTTYQGAPAFYVDTSFRSGTGSMSVSVSHP
jgi:hypothetical protein